MKIATKFFQERTTMNHDRELIVIGVTLLAMGALLSCRSASQVATSSPSGIGEGISDDLRPSA